MTIFTPLSKMLRGKTVTLQASPAAPQSLPRLSVSAEKPKVRPPTREGWREGRVRCTCLACLCQRTCTCQCACLCASARCVLRAVWAGKTARSAPTPTPCGAELCKTARLLVCALTPAGPAGRGEESPPVIPRSLRQRLWNELRDLPRRDRHQIPHKRQVEQAQELGSGKRFSPRVESLAQELRADMRFSLAFAPLAPSGMHCNAARTTGQRPAQSLSRSRARKTECTRVPDAGEGIMSDR